MGIVAETFDRDSWLVGAGLSFSPQNTFTFFVNVNGEFQSGLKLLSVLAGIRGSW